MKIFRTLKGIIIERQDEFYNLADATWPNLFKQSDLRGYLEEELSSKRITDGFEMQDLLPPIERQEVWACGVTYKRSRSARMEESKTSSGGDFYDRVYTADRPEIFFKATDHRVSGHLQPVQIRKDSKWNVPEPELALVLNIHGDIIGYTIGNDMSSRDIEGENPLYLPQAKVYNRCCGLGPGFLVYQDGLDPETQIAMEIRRQGERIFEGLTHLSGMKRSFANLTEYLFRDNSFPEGCILMTGTGIVPPDDFTLQAGDIIRITIDPIGTLENRVE